MPATMLATYFLMPLIGKPIPDPHFPMLMAPVLFAVFFVLAIGEEAGWSGYVIGGLQARWGALVSSIVLGIAWAAWHIVPFIQAHHASNWWTVWQCLGTVPLRVLMVWIYNNTGRNILAMVLFHAMINESEMMFPNLGSHYVCPLSHPDGDGGHCRLPLGRQDPCGQDDGGNSVKKQRQSSENRVLPRRD